MTRKLKELQTQLKEEQDKKEQLVRNGFKEQE